MKNGINRGMWRIPLWLLLFFGFSFSLFASSIQQRLEEASKKEKMGAYEEAESLYQTILKEEPENEKGLLGLGGVQYWQGKYAEALKSYFKILEKNPDHLETLLGISKTELALGNEEKASHYLSKAKKIDPTNEEVKSLEPQLARTTRIKIKGGYIFENPSYATDTQGEYQEITVSKEKRYGFGLKATYLNKFGKKGFDTDVFGNYYFQEKTRIDAGVTFSPNVTILPKQSYYVSISHPINKFRPEVRYRFQDWSEANTHSVIGALFFEPISFLKWGGGYEYQHLTAPGLADKLHSVFTQVDVSPTTWSTLYAHYSHIQRGFEGGRTPTPYVAYSANVGGGGAQIDLMANYYFAFDVSYENRDNGESVTSYTLSAGITF